MRFSFYSQKANCGHLKLSGISGYSSVCFSSVVKKNWINTLVNDHFRQVRFTRYSRKANVVSTIDLIYITVYTRSPGCFTTNYGKVPGNWPTSFFVSITTRNLFPSAIIMVKLFLIAFRPIRANRLLATTSRTRRAISCACEPYHQFLSDQLSNHKYLSRQ